MHRRTRVLYDILQTGYRDLRRYPLTASGEEQIVILQKPNVLRGVVTDMATGYSVAVFQMIAGQKFPDGRTHWRRDVARNFAGGKFEWTFGGMVWPDQTWLLRVEAEGYQSAVAEIPGSGEETVLNFSLHPGSSLSGRAVKADGSPAREMSVVLVSEMGVQLENGKPRTNHGDLQSVTGSDGRFSFPSQDPPYALVIASDYGFAVVTDQEFAKNPLIAVQPWGRVEVITERSGTAGAPVPFGLTIRDLPNGRNNRPWVFGRPLPKREAPNKIVFEKVPPGRVWIYHSGIQTSRESLEINVEPGRTTTLDFDRGTDESGGRIPGILPVKVVDEAGNPIEGAAITLSSFSLKGGRGNLRSFMSAACSAEPKMDAVTGKLGVAKVGYSADGKDADATGIQNRN